MPGGTHDPDPPRLPRFRLRGSHPLRRPVPAAFGQPGIRRRGPCRALRPARPTPGRHRRQAVPPPRFGLPPFRSPLLRGSSLFLRVLRCFSSPGAPPVAGVPARSAGGLPHSDTPGSQAASASPGRFAARPRPSSAAGAKASPVRPSPRPCRVSLARSRPSGPARAERPSAVVAALRIGFPVFRRQCVSGCLCVFCTRTGASTTPSPPSSNGGPGVPAVHGREAWVPRASGCQGANGTGGRVMHRAEDGAVGRERRTIAARCVAVPPRRRRVAAGRSTPVGGTPRDRCRPAVGSPVPRSTWVGGVSPRSLERR